MADPTEDSSSPYFLSLADQTGRRIVHDVLTGDNYVQWSKSVKMALAEKNKFGFVDGTISKPTDDPVKISAWDKVNRLVMLWIVDCVAETINPSLPDFEIAKELWDELKLRFEKNDVFRVFELEKLLITMSQGSRSVTSYYDDFKKVWDEYCRYRPVLKCMCGLCTCNIGQALSEIQQKDAVTKFLMGLNESFSAIRSQLLLQTPLPSLSKVFSALIEEESQRAIQNFNESSDSAAMLTTQSEASGLANNYEEFKKKYPHCTAALYETIRGPRHENDDLILPQMDFDRPDDINSTRILFIRKEPPFKETQRNEEFVGPHDNFGHYGDESDVGASPTDGLLGQNPVVSQMLQNLFSNRQYMEQILGLDPQFRGMLDMNTPLREMMQNLDFLRQLTSPEMMQFPVKNSMQIS